MSVVKRRYYFWLIKAYFKRWNKTILSSLGIGVGIFFLIFFIFNFYFLPMIEKKVQRIGYYGTYTASEIPTDILSEISYGLTQVAPDGSVTGAAAYKWEIKNNGKEYVFYIKKGQYFDEDEELNAHNINLSFQDVKQKVIDDYTIQFSLAQAYSPFLVTASKPILTDDFKGLGKYKVKNADLNAGFVRSLTLQDKEDSESKKVLNFYPTEQALKLAYALGDVDHVSNVKNPMVKGRELAGWINTTAEKTTDLQNYIKF